MEQKIFLTVGRTFTRQQEDFVSLLEEFMRSQGVITQSETSHLLAPNADPNAIFLAES